MKKFVMSLVAAFAISPVMAEDSVNLAGLGLGNLQPVSEAAGMKVRGMSSSTQGMSMGTASLLIIDPLSGTQYSSTAASFNFSSAESGGTGEFDDSISNTGISLGWGADFGYDGEGTSFTGGGSGGVFSFGQGGSDYDFNWTMPSFGFIP